MDGQDRVASCASGQRPPGRKSAAVSGLITSGSTTRDFAMLAWPDGCVTVALSVGWPSFFVSPSIWKRRLGENGSAAQPVAW